MNYQSLLYSSDRGRPPNILGGKDILIFSAKEHNLFECVYDYVVLAFKGDIYRTTTLLVCDFVSDGAGLPLRKLIDFAYIIIPSVGIIKCNNISNSFLAGRYI